jgi:ankyrin repeat protein
VGVLLEAGANKDAVNKAGETPKDVAKKEGYNDIVKRLNVAVAYVDHHTPMSGLVLAEGAEPH